MDPRVKSQNTSFIFMSCLFGNDLKGEVMKLIFDGEVMKPVTSDVNLFISVMNVFTQSEKTSKRYFSQVNNLLFTFLNNFDAVFQHEFPFFILLGRRLRKFQKFYNCDQLEVFVKRCIDTFESLTPQQISETLHNFFIQKDFEISYGPEEINISVFQLLANACEYMMNLSSQVKYSDQVVVASSLVYSRILWISVHLKCLCEKGVVTYVTDDVWQQHLLKPQVSQSIELKQTVIENFKLGLSLTSLLQLPPEVQFTVHHMIYFIANEQFIRPLIKAKEFVLALESNIKNDHELLVHVLAKLRVLYSPFLTSSDPKNVGCASQKGNISAVLDEGISFLDGMTELWFRRGWHKGEQHKDFRNECLQWLKLLLKTVKVTDPSAHQLLEKFLAQSHHGIVADQEFRNNIVKQILEDTRNSFPSLSIQSFFTLYKTFNIWPIDFVHDFLKQYHIPDTVKINDTTWTEFFGIIIERFPQEEHQDHLLTFLCKVGDCYKESGRAEEFIPDLLQLDVPQLCVFSTDATDTIQEVEETSTCQTFSVFLKSYIQQNSLQPIILANMSIPLSRIIPRFNFHWIILDALQVVHIISDLEMLNNEHIKSIFSESLQTLHSNIEWFGPLSACQKFCWSVVSTVCSNLSVTVNNLDWVSQYESIIIDLIGIFRTYCRSRKIYGTNCLLSDYTPDEVQHCPWDDVNKYFQWVCKVQVVLRFWQTKFHQHEVNYDEILWYASNNVPMNAIGEVVSAPSFVMDPHSISQVSDYYIDRFEQLNLYLLQFVPGHPELTYITLPTVLSKYGVELPPHIQEVISTKVMFPGKQNVPEKERLVNVIPKRMFKTGEDIRLNVSKAMTLANLQQLVKDLGEFLGQLYYDLDVLVFFHFHQSEMFKTYLLMKLQTVSLPSVTEVGKRSLLSSDGFTQEDQSTGYHGQLSMGVSSKTLGQAVEWVEDLLLRMLNGTATYEDIITEGALKWELDKEFSILSKFSEVRKEHCEGLQGSFSILELFQFTYHIQSIYDVCEQYGLVNCLEDHTLKELIVIIEEPEGALVTPHEAIQKVNVIKELLNLKEEKIFNCLHLFSAVSNNTNVYQFIQDKQFVGERLATFHEQYQLITAQMKHNETVMNHLLSVFEFLTPLLDQQDITFPDLMSKVSHLDTTYCLKQLETVNESMSLIQLWFSRFEDATLSFDNALSTGSFNFQLSDVQSDENEAFQPQQFKVDEQNWTHEQIADYARRLGFIDAEEAAMKQRISKHYQDKYYQLEEIHQQQLTRHSQLQDEHGQLQQSHQQQQEEHYQLDITHKQQQNEYIQLQKAHQQLTGEFTRLQDHHRNQEEVYQQEQKEHSLLRKEHQQQQEQFSLLQIAHQQQLQDHHQLQEMLEQTQKELGTKQEEMDRLHRKISVMEDSWKVSHREVTFSVELLGRGAWGAIRVAMFREQRVAVKQMHEFIINEDMLALLRREINTMAQLRHPNLLQFIGAVLDHPSGNPMIITEIMDTSLRNAYETKQLTPDPSCESVLLTIMRDVAVGLNYLHCLPHPIIHRDVSSSNVLLESKGPHKWKTKISDFGSANKAHYAVTRAAGAPVYSAPESLTSIVSVQKVLTTKMDVFSYGVLLFEVMTCRFPDSSIFHAMLQQVHSRSPSLYDLIFSCIKEDPSSRPIMKQVIDHLDIYIKQRPK